MLGIAIVGPLLHAADVVGVPGQRVLHLPDPPYQYANVPTPSFYMSNPVHVLDNTPANNPITDAGAALGRVLFYDTRLSANNTVSCGSCHQQAHAFSDPRQFSVGFAGQKTDRHAMSLVDVRYYARGRMFWDERAASLEEQVLMPIQNSHEMGQALPKLMQIISADANYPGLYEKAFGDRAITIERTAQALAQFLRTLVSYSSKYDKGLAVTGSIGVDFPNFTPLENRGKAAFLNRCGVCHLPPGQGVIFTSQVTRNNGLDADAKVKDLGVADVTFNRFHAGLFKSPSLRNVEYTGPYMHDGRFATLEQVIEHYSSGVKAHPNLAPQLGGPPARLRMNADEKAGLLAFLKTLSDPEFIKDPRFSDPFEKGAPVQPARVSQVRNVSMKSD
jgi:cytochrome c peroxidase